jgi:outer membrane protein TolC
VHILQADLRAGGKEVSDPIAELRDAGLAQARDAARLRQELDDVKAEACRYERQAEIDQEKLQRLVERAAELLRMSRYGGLGGFDEQYQERRDQWLKDALDRRD